MAEGASFGEIVAAIILAIVLIPIFIIGFGILLVILSYTWPIIFIIVVVWILVAYTSKG